MWTTLLVLTGETFQSTVTVKIQLVDRGDLTNGMASRIVEDIGDALAKVDLKNVRWETYAVDTAAPVAVFQRRAEFNDIADAITRLQQERDEAIKQRDGAIEHLGRWEELANKREATVDRLMAALRKYGQHEPGCPTIADDDSDQVLYDYQQCGCGLGEILAALAPADPEGK